MTLRTPKCLLLGLALLAFLLHGRDVFAQTKVAADDVSASVEEAVWRFHAADTARDAEAVIDLLSPEFYMLVDGNRANYEEVVAGTRRFMSNVKLFHTEWTDLRVTPLGPDHAVASFIFRDSIITKTGDVIRKSGPTTFVWQRRDAGWRLLYADADHY